MQNVDSNLLAVYWLQRGLKCSCLVRKPQAFWTVLSADPRLSLGSLDGRRHRETEKLICVICPLLQPEDREQLLTILEFITGTPKGIRDVDFRRRGSNTNPEHQLFLLKPFLRSIWVPRQGMEGWGRGTCARGLTVKEEGAIITKCLTCMKRMKVRAVHQINIC